MDYFIIMQIYMFIKMKSVKSLRELLYFTKILLFFGSDVDLWYL